MHLTQKLSRVKMVAAVTGLLLFTCGLAVENKAKSLKDKVKN
jgi:hypothetical protein